MSDYTSDLNAILSEDFAKVDGSTYHTEIQDEHDALTIDKNSREITAISGETLVVGDANSAIKTFLIDRYYDGVDLSEKSIKIVYQRSDGEGDIVDATDLMVGTDQITFCWLLNEHALYTGGDLDFIVEFIGTDESGDTYVLKTKTCTLHPDTDTLIDMSVVSPAQSWIVDVERRLTDLETYGTGGGTGTGTTNYEALRNLPQINSVELKGNKTLSDLGIAAASHTHTQYMTESDVDSKVSTAVPAYVDANKDDLKGDNGLSAYEVWLANGNTGTEADFLASIIGADGDSAYQTWLDNGHSGTEDDFLASLIGITPNMTVGTVTSLSAGSTPTVTFTGTTENPVVNFGIPRGASGTNGVSPTVDISKTGKITTITITDANGTHTATINDGVDGTSGDGSGGGISPTVAISKVDGVTTITITDAEGVHTATINDGEDGEAGKDGVSATHSWNGTTLSITSASGTSSVDLKGEKGDPGVTPNLQIGTVTTLDAGQNATASITGTPETPTLSLGIPRGADGSGESGVKNNCGKAVFIGDSVSAGYNNDGYSFVDVASESGDFTSVVKLAQGGATLGPYSVTELGTGYSCTEQISNHESDIMSADMIFLQFGANDVQSTIAQAVTMGNQSSPSTEISVCGYLKNAIETIFTLNPSAKLYFLNLGHNDSTLRFISEAYEAYFTNNGYPVIPADTMYQGLTLWNATAVPIMISYGIRVIDILDDTWINALTSSAVSSDDHIHPNDFGHKRMYDNIIGKLYNNSVTGLSSYEEWLANGNAGTETEFLESIIGVTPDLQIGTVTTLDAGRSATASITGTPETPLLNLGIPRGATPVKGVDYFTDSDKSELVDTVLASLTSAEEVAF